MGVGGEEGGEEEEVGGMKCEKLPKDYVFCSS